MARTIAIRITVDSANASSQTNAMKAAVDLLTKAIDKLNATLVMTVGMMSALTKVQGQTAAATQNMNQTFLTVNNTINMFDNSVVNNTKNINNHKAAIAASSQSMTGAVFASGALARATQLLKQALGDGLREAIEFEDSLNRTKVIANLSGEQLADLKGRITELGLSFGTPVANIADTALQMAKMGLSGDNLAKSLKSVIYLSNALGESPAMTGEFIAQIGNAFGMTGDQLVRVADQIAYATGQSAAKINDFKVAFGYVGAVAANANISFGELAGTLGFLSNRGISASTMGTGLRRIIMDLGLEGSKAANMIGGTTNDMSLVEALRRLADLNLNSGQFKKIFSLPSLPVAQSLAGELKDVEALDDFIDKTNSAYNYVMALGEGVGTSVAQNFGKLKNSITLATDSLGDLLSTILGFGDGSAASTALGNFANAIGLFGSAFRGVDAFLKAHPLIEKLMSSSGGIGPMGSGDFGQGFFNDDKIQTGLDLTAAPRDPTMAIYDQYEGRNKYVHKNTPDENISAAKKGIDLIKAQIDVMGDGGQKLDLDKATKSLQAYIGVLKQYPDNTKANQTEHEAYGQIKDIANLPLPEIQKSFDLIRDGIKDTEDAGNSDGLVAYRQQLLDLITSLGDPKTKEGISLLTQMKGTLRATNNASTKDAKNEFADFKGNVESDEASGVFVSSEDRAQQLDGLIAKFKGIESTGMDKVIGDMEKLRATIDAPAKKNSWSYQFPLMVDHFKKEAKEYEGAAKILGAVTGEVDKGVGKFSDMFGNQLVESLVRGENAFQDFDDFFGDFAKSIVSDIISVITQMLVLKAIMIGFGLLTGGGAAAVSVPGTFENLAGVGDGLGLGLGNTVVGASGFDGTVHGPTRFMAGEAGPEKVSITPAAKTANSGSSGGGATFIINGDVHDYQSFARKVKKAQSRNSKKYV